MDSIKLEGDHQNAVDASYKNEASALQFVHLLKNKFSDNRWFYNALIHIEQGFMAIRTGITENYKETKGLND